ncbi:MAG: hypothetical protein M3456_14015 [Actinomycetota bacterium]|nr:hypothetical protein [Actinomycetota bacterium]
MPGGWSQTEGYVPLPFNGRRFHPHSLAPEEVAEGGCFDYGGAPPIFLGRKGRGPLRIAWGTNILIDWRHFGEILRSDDNGLPDGLDSGHEEDLVALGSIMGFIWMIRDIRIRCFLNQRDDFRRVTDRETDDRRRSERDREITEIAAAVRCVKLDEPSDQEIRSNPDWAARFMSRSFDHDLVEQAIVSGCHDFLTRDQGILRHAESLEALGLRVVRPCDLWDDLLYAGELSNPVGPDGMACDSHKWHHLGSVFLAGASSAH